ncbi:MAG: hypothetical protein ACI4T4_01675 [Limosilactobacillus sp.]
MKKGGTTIRSSFKQLVAWRTFLFVFKIINGEVSTMQESDISDISNINSFQSTTTTMMLISAGDWQR